MKYFKQDLSRGFASLYASRIIVLIAGGLMGIFLPIFLYKLFDNNFQYVMIYYMIGSLVYLISLPTGAIFLNHFGFRRALMFSSIIGALFFSSFYFIDKTNIIPLTIFSIITLAIYRLFYWVPYHTDFAKFTIHKDRSKNISLLSATEEIMGVAIPFLSGAVITYFDYDMLFFIAIILYMISFFPYLLVPHTEEEFSWTLKETWKNFTTKKPKIILAFVAEGAETSVGLVVWPIFIYQILEGDYLKIGSISTLIVGISVILQLTLGKKLDDGLKKRKVLKLGSLFYSIGWLVKIFITTAFQVFIAGTYHNIVKIFLRTPFDALTYDIAADEGHYVDEFSVLHEMGIHTGKILMLSAIIIISTFFSIKWVFVLAAVASMLFSSLKREEVVK